MSRCKFFNFDYFLFLAIESYNSRSTDNFQNYLTIVCNNVNAKTEAESGCRPRKYVISGGNDDGSSRVVTAPQSFALIFAKEPNDPTAVKSPRLMPVDLLSRRVSERRNARSLHD